MRAISGLATLLLLATLLVVLDRPLPAQAVSTIATPNSPASTSTEFTAIGAGLSISGFTSDIRVILSTSDANGELRLSSATGLALVSGYDNSSVITDAGDEIAFEGSQSNANTALAGLEYQGTTAGSDTISIEVLDKGISPVELSGVYHYYGLSSGSSTFTFSQAKTGAATSQTINGNTVTPWLATVGSSAENLAISNYVDADAWIGAEITSTVGTTRTWSWGTSNAADGLSGAVFATDEQGGGCALKGGVTSEPGYQNFYDYRDPNNEGADRQDWIEPNNCNTETAAYMYRAWTNSDGNTWNDKMPSATYKYIWEYASATALSLNDTFTTVVDSSESEPGSAPSETTGQGIFLYLAASPGAPAEGCAVYYGSVRIKPNTTYLLSLQSVTNPALTRKVLATGATNDWGHADKRLEMGKLDAGTYKVVMTGTHPEGYPLVLTNYISVDRSGNFISLSPESLQPILN